MKRVSQPEYTLEYLTKNINCSEKEAGQAFLNYESPILFIRINSSENHFEKESYSIIGENFKSFSLKDFFDLMPFGRVIFGVYPEGILIEEFFFKNLNTDIVDGVRRIVYNNPVAWGGAFIFTENGDFFYEPNER